MNISTSFGTEIIADTATGTQYELRQMTAEERDKHLAEVNSRIRFDSEGKPVGTTRLEGLQASLVSRCLFDSSGKPVPVQTIQSWPAATVQSLFDLAQQMNMLNRPAETEPKKD